MTFQLRNPPRVEYSRLRNSLIKLGQEYDSKKVYAGGEEKITLGGDRGGADNQQKTKNRRLGDRQPNMLNYLEIYSGSLNQKSE